LVYNHHAKSQNRQIADLEAKEELMRRLLLPFVVLLFAASQSRADLIVDGGFENFTTSGFPYDGMFGGGITTFFGPPDTTQNAELNGWTIIGNSGGYPNNVDLVPNTYWPSFAGHYSLDMSGLIGSAGVIQQSFATTPGATYDLSFEYANNPGVGRGVYGATGNVSVTGLATLLIQDLSHNTSTFANMDYQLFSADFVADSATTTLQFTEYTNSGYGVVLDAVDVAPIPEPSSASLLVLSLLGVSLVCVTGRLSETKRK